MRTNLSVEYQNYFFNQNIYALKKTWLTEIFFSRYTFKKKNKKKLSPQFVFFRDLCISWSFNGIEIA